MKEYIYTLAIFLSGIFCINAQNSIEVEISNFASDKGIAMVGLFNSEASFMDDGYMGKEVEIKDNKAFARFKDIPDGTYAILIYHDENKNGELDKFLGIPREDYGASNQAHSRLGPPRWQDARFEVKGGEIVKQSIKL
jgi:uncharacterized protein (DUF2141 family)